MNATRSMELLYNLTDWIVRMLAVNLLWIIFNIPIIFLLINLFLAKSTNELIAIGIILWGIVPFLFFPATTSLFAVVRNWVLKKQDLPIIHSFWKFYKENYTRSMIAGIIIGFMWLIAIVDYYFFTAQISVYFKYPFIVIFIYLFVYTLHFISGTVHFETKLFTSLKNALFITIGSPISNLGLSILNGVIIYISFNYFTFIIPLFIGSIIALISFLGFYKIYIRVEESKP